MIEIKVKDKVATRTDDAQLVCSNSYTVHFTFDAEWAGQSTKTMRVQNGTTYADVSFTGDTVALPVYDSARVLSIGVYAGNLTTTTPAFLRMQESIRSRGGSQSAPTPSVYDQLIAAINARANDLDYDDGTLELKAGSTVLAEVEVSEFGFATEEWVEGQGYLTEHQSLAAYRTSAAQDIIDSGKQATISDLATIRSGAALGATALQEHQSLAAYRTSANQDAIDSAIESDVDAIEAKIPAQATSSNQLADRSFVNSSINSVTAYYITKTAAGAQFATHAELAAATTFYSGGDIRVPTRNDYCIVQSDENHENATTRYIYQNSQWEFQYIVNETALTSDQLAALNSGITSDLVGGYNTHLADTGIHVTSTEKSTWSAKESTANKVTSLSSASTDTQYPSAKCVYDATKPAKYELIETITLTEDVASIVRSQDPQGNPYDFSGLFIAYKPTNAFSSQWVKIAPTISWTALSFRHSRPPESFHAPFTHNGTAQTYFQIGLDRADGLGYCWLNQATTNPMYSAYNGTTWGRFLSTSNITAITITNQLGTFTTGSVIEIYARR